MHCPSTPLQVLVGEPSVPDTVQILRGLKERYASHHGVQISDRALVVAAELADRYITSRFLPGGCLAGAAAFESVLRFCCLRRAAGCSAASAASTAGGRAGLSARRQPPPRFGRAVLQTRRLIWWTRRAPTYR